MTALRRRALLAGTAAIAWAALAAAGQAITYTETGIVENITVTQTGTYRIAAGGGKNGDPETTGFGALVAGDLFMQSGSRYSVLVGGNGQRSGGGGASMFTYAANRAVVDADRAIAGGGSGDGNPGLADPLGSGEGGEGLGGGGGGGLYGFGGGGGAGGAPLTGTAAGGSGFCFGPGSYPCGGGFGGGGGGYQGYITFQYSGSGGGGGFTGGRGGDDNFSPDSPIPASGGGSYLSASFANQIKTTGGATNGAFVSVDLIAPIPAPGALGLIGSAMAGLVLAARRRKLKD